MESRHLAALFSVALAMCTYASAQKATDIDQSLIVGIWYREIPDVVGTRHEYTEYRKDGTFLSIARLHSKHVKGRTARWSEHYGTWKLSGRKLKTDGFFNGRRFIGNHRGTNKILELTENYFVFRNAFKWKMEKVDWLSSSARTSESDTILDFADERVTPPSLILWINAVYPNEIRRSDLRGEVHLEFIVDVNGYPRDVVVIEATNEHFAQAAIDAISQWRYKPAQDTESNYGASRAIQQISFVP